MSKVFTPNLYLEANDSGILTAVSFLESLGFDGTSVDKTEVYKDWDFTIVDPLGKLQRVEVEIKHVWEKQGCWEKYRTIDIPYRKKESLADIFIMINKFHNTLAMIDFSTILKSPIIKKDTIYTTAEEFFSVDVKYFQFYYLDSRNHPSNWIEINPYYNKLS